jgi:hypothetical protein
MNREWDLRIISVLETKYQVVEYQGSWDKCSSTPLPTIVGFRLMVKMSDRN